MHFWKVPYTVIAATSLASCHSATENAPWADMPYKICATSNDNDLRAVVFAPELLERSYGFHNLAQPKLEFNFKTRKISERITIPESSKPGWYLKGQSIGYINAKNEWVNENGKYVTSFDQFTLIKGKDEDPDIRYTGTYTYQGKTPSDRDYKLWHEDSLALMANAENCRVYHDSGPILDIRELVDVDFGINNPMICGDDGRIKRSTELNHSVVANRNVVTRVHQSSSYVKTSSGNVARFGELTDLFAELKAMGEDLESCDWQYINFEDRK